MKAITFFKIQRIRAKINIILGSFFLFVLVSLYILYKNQVNKTFVDTHAFMSESLVDITEMMRIVESKTDSGFTKADYNLLKPFFQNKKYYETGYPFLVNRKGDFLIHPWKEGTNEAQSQNHIQRLSYGEGAGYFRYIFSGEKRMKWQYVHYFKPYDAYVAVTFYEDELFRNLSQFRTLFIVLIVLALIIFFLGTVITINPIVKAINHVNKSIGEVAKGKIVDPIKIKRKDEIGEMIQSINSLIDEISKKTHFSNEIAKGNFDSELKVKSNDDILGNSLLNMRDNIKAASKKELERNQEIEKQRWSSEGLAKFGEILRQSNLSMEDFSYSIISNLVKYVNANQGGLFTVNEDNAKEVFIELTACYAYEKRKFLTKTLALGEGLVGQCFLEKETIYLTDIPESYTDITSGLGKGSPRFILIVPLVINEKSFGVIELASFSPFEQHVIQFVEKVGESIASTISNLRVNLHTSKLLEQTQIQAEQMQSQEEELRQNMEEMLATQEEMHRREKEQKDEIARLNEENAQLRLSSNASQNSEDI